MSLALRDRFRLFFRGAAKELALAASHARELRRYRDGLNELAEWCAAPFRPVEGRLYVRLDSELLVRVVERVYGVDHPYARAICEKARLARIECERRAKGAATADDSGEYVRQTSK
jgi:hypothetical protein